MFKVVTKFKSLFLLVILSLVLTSCRPACTPETLGSFLQKTDAILTEFRGNISYGFNHPKLKPSLAHEMKGMRADIRIMETPWCAVKYQKLMLDAMESSISFFANDKDRYYSRSELSQIADGKWKIAEGELNRMLIKHPIN